MSVSLGELAVRFGCELRGDPEARIEHVGTLANADGTALSFLANPRYRPQLASTRAAAVVLSAEAAADCPTHALLSANPYATYARIAALLHPGPGAEPGVHPTALIAASARLDPSAHVGPGCCVGEDVVIGARAVLGPLCVLQQGVVLEADVRLVARVTLCRGVTIGARSVLQPGVVVGGDGFGYAPEGGRWLKVPQVGAVRIGADVEIGCNTTIDRGAIDDTVIEEGVKLDNLIQIGHNVRVGAHTAIAGCTGVSGSTVIGKRCMIGGHVGFAGHISVADDVVVTGYSAISHSIGSAGVYSSTLPFEEAHAWRRLVARFKRSARLEQRVRTLERAAGLNSGQEDTHD
ncbi:MAG TPA: UDP-3-O-(3-hydroxymyristoyl)glucosamine N-acyltransferase [Steroidobacteraceae bacterium]|jgi:UDP-3-O-[3-hydroxymyristoyl] glucosamine N-acyltransferase|nr:UDP-3-O-(3-hydroxymyristoyl)glucosamine N-acyltransferase [Steroidobacteraceae bacterium]